MFPSICAMTEYCGSHELAFGSLQICPCQRSTISPGFNTYVGLWKGPTEQQLSQLKETGMGVICHQNEVGLRHINDPTIVGWMHGDEPDNAQPLAKGKGYGPPIPPRRIVESYRKMRRANSSRPVLVNLGQGVAWDGWHGWGVRANHREDYPQYVRGCDIMSFDIYPVVHTHPGVSGKLWYVARGIQRLVHWTKGDKIVWNYIECTRIKNPKAKPTPFYGYFLSEPNVYPNEPAARFRLYLPGQNGCNLHHLTVQFLSR